MAMKPAELGALVSGDQMGQKIAFLWNKLHTQRAEIIAEWKEQRNFLFATDTTKTSQRKNHWKNTTTLPKLTQIRDNLHSNYLSALFPNDEWLKWEGYSLEDSIKEKAATIQAYMQNKVRMGNFRDIASTLLYDYIDYGISIATPTFETRWKMVGEEQVTGFIGPKAVRISPMDIVFNPLAAHFTDTYKIIRTVRTIGELKVMAQEQPDNAYLMDVINNSDLVRAHAGAFSIEDSDHAEAMLIEGYGNLQEYYESDYVEILEFWGDWHDSKTGVLMKNQVITVIDRARVIRQADIPSWLGHVPIYAASWRKRPDNLWPMGPLLNLVGMQYRMDHLENAKADAWDLSIHPPLAIIGDVEQFEWGPGTEVHLDEGGSVQEIQKNLNAIINADTGIAILAQQMEQFAGAPREAMGIRSPGEKTKFEVQELQNAAGRIFQEKIITFETELLEPLLNGMLETARRNLDGNDVVSVLDGDLAVKRFQTITREDITANGVLRPIGARHFAAQAQLVQNLIGMLNGPLGEKIAPHISGKQTAKLVEDVLGLERFEIFSPNIAVIEAKETQQLMNQAEEELVAEDEVAGEI